MKNRIVSTASLRSWKHIPAACFGLGVLAMIGFSALAATAGTSQTEATCDATTSASVKIVTVKTTTTSATLTWTEREHGSSRYFCYGIGTASKCALVQSRARGSKDQTVTGLTANTKYAYQFYGIHGGTQHLSIVNGTLTTDGSACGAGVITTVEVDGTVLSAAGDSLGNVVATISKNGAVVAVDTTNPSGMLHFTVDPGTYVITVSYPPFTAPAPYTANVVINKPISLPDQIMTGAFQVSGTIVNSSGADSGIKVTLRKKSDNSVVAVHATDPNGYYSFGVLAGDYALSATYLALTVAPYNFTVTKSMKLPDLNLTTVGLFPISRAVRIPRFIQGQSVKGYDVKGACREDASGSRAGVLFQAR